MIHTVGPNAHRGQTDAGLLASCFTRSLDVAAELGATSVAFPAISAGVYGWDAREVAEVAKSALAADRWPDVREVRFVLFNDSVAQAFVDVFGLELERGR